MISSWINRSPHHDFELSKKERRFLRDVALRTWRYFAEFSNEKNHWLIPDNVQEEPLECGRAHLAHQSRVAVQCAPGRVRIRLHHAARVSDADGTNARDDLETASFSRALANWYDTTTLKPFDSPFISSVDSGNFVASLWSLRQGCIELSRRPLLGEERWKGWLIAGVRPSNPPRIRASGRRSLRVQHLRSGCRRLLGRDDRRPTENLAARLEALRALTQDFLPWHLPEYEALRKLDRSIFEWPVRCRRPSLATSSTRNWKRAA